MLSIRPAGKRLHIMREFAEQIGGLPGNVCAMTFVTEPDALHRVDELRQIKAACRGLSVEQLWERIPPESLDLVGIDWLILAARARVRATLGRHADARTDAEQSVALAGSNLALKTQRQNDLTRLAKDIPAYADYVKAHSGK